MNFKNFYHNKRVVVTGGCGFIGSHLSQKLVDLGAHVTIIDDLSTGKLENIENFKNNVNFVHKSIVEKEACLAATKGADIIFHLAAFISVPQSIEQPDVCHSINVDGTLNMLEAARINGVQRFVFSSSAAVYGNKHEPCSEEMDCSPESPYGYAKLIGELYCKQYAKVFGLNTVILRYFNVYGERQNPNGAYAGVVAKFTHQIRNNLPITIYGDGLQTRDFTPVADVVQANLKLGMLADAVPGEVFNVATGKSITLLELVDRLQQEAPEYNHPVTFMPARQGDIEYSAAHCEKYYTV